METKIRAIRSDSTGNQIDLKASRDGDLRVVQYLPSLSMLSAAGKVFGGDTSGGTAAIPVTAAPTTSPEWAIYNANSPGGASLVMISVSAWMSEGIAGLGMAIMCATAIGAQTAITANASGCVTSALFGTSAIPNAYVASNPTLLGGTPSWVTVAAYDQIGSDGVGEGLVADLHGMFVIPPRGLFCAEVVAETGTGAKYDLSFVFAQVQMDTQ